VRQVHLYQLGALVDVTPLADAHAVSLKRCRCITSVAALSRVASLVLFDCIAVADARLLPRCEVGYSRTVVAPPRALAPSPSSGGAGLQLTPSGGAKPMTDAKIAAYYATLPYYDEHMRRRRS
jgi:hypothetical protein